MEKNILRQIYFDNERHWDRFVEKYGDRIRPIVVKEVEKFRDCGNPKNGFKILGLPRYKDRSVPMQGKILHNMLKWRNRGMEPNDGRRRSPGKSSTCRVYNRRRVKNNIPEISTIA